MKNKLFLVLIVFLIHSCSNRNNQSDVFESDKLQGKYKVDVSSLIQETTKEAQETKDEWDDIGAGIVSLALSSLDIEMSFYENKKGMIYVGGGIMDFISGFSGEEDLQHYPFEYRVVHDSVLYMKGGMNENEDFLEWAIVRKFNESYDYIKLFVIDKESGGFYFNLKKINEPAE